MRARMLFTTFAMFVLLAGVAVQQVPPLKLNMTSLRSPVKWLQSTARLACRSASRPLSRWRLRLRSQLHA